MIKENTIRKPDQSIITSEQLKDELSSLIDSEAKVAIGSDSQVLSHYTHFVTTICIHYPGYGGKFFYIKKKEFSNLFPNMRLRILNETLLSLEAANDILDMTGLKVEVHIDIGSDEKVSKTSRLYKELSGIVSSSGYECKIKPDSWASYVADRFTKN